MTGFSRTVLLLAAISFFTDMASEMLYPVMPLYLRQLGYGLVFVGVLEACAALMIGVLKLYSGVLADRRKVHVPLIRIGYGIAAVAKPLIGLTSNFGAIFTLRMIDRAGKGLRETPRDTLLVHESTEETRGATFGFHRAGDTFGAAFGPLVALIILGLSAQNLHLVFYATAIPGAIAIFLTFLIHEPKETLETPDTTPHHPMTPGRLLARMVAFWRTASPRYRSLLSLFVCIALLKSTDVFLLVRARELGLSPALVITCYIIYNVIYALGAYILGARADTRGFRMSYLMAVLAFVVVYGLMATAGLPLWLVVLAFILNGVFIAGYDGLTGAWLTLHMDRKDVGTGLGLLYFAQACATFLGALAVGAALTAYGAATTFGTIAILAAVAGLGFLRGA